MGDKKKFSDLAEDLLVSIAERLDTRVDVKRFRAVCSSWRFSVGPPPVVQLPIFSFWVPRLNVFEPIRYDIKLLETTVYSLEEITTGKRMLIRVRETGQGGVEIKDPFGRSIEEEFGRRKVIIDLLNFRVSKITKLYHLHEIPGDKYKSQGDRLRPCDKVALIPHNNYYNNNNPPILASHCGKFRSDGYFGKLAECLIYNGTLSNFDESSRIVQHKGKLYESSHKWGFVQVYDDYNSLAPGGAKINIPGSDLDYYDSNIFVVDPTRRCYYYILVSCGAHLFLVKKLTLLAYDIAGYQKGGGDKDYIQVYKLDEEQQQWVQVRNLGDRAFILCHDRSFTVSVRDFAGIETGVFYFLDSDIWFQRGEEEETKPKLCVWAFSLEKGTLWTLPHDGRYLFY